MEKTRQKMGGEGESLARTAPPPSGRPPRHAHKVPRRPLHEAADETSGEMPGDSAAGTSALAPAAEAAPLAVGADPLPATEINLHVDAPGTPDDWPQLAMDERLPHAVAPALGGDNLATPAVAPSSPWFELKHLLVLPAAALGAAGGGGGGGGSGPANTGPRQIALAEDSVHVLTAGDLSLGGSAIVIASLPVHGVLLFNGQPASVGQSVTLAQLAQLTFTPSANVHGTALASFSYTVPEQPGTTFQAVFNVSAVNDLPGGTLLLAGGAVVGQTLSLSNQISDADGLGSMSYRWQTSANGYDGWADIAGATGLNFTLTAAQLGLHVRAVASYTDADGTAEAVSSYTTPPTVAVNHLPSGSVAVSGTVREGQTLTASNTLDDADGLGTVSYQWQVSADGVSGWQNIAGATGASLTLTETQVGRHVRALASYADFQGTTEAVASAGTVAVAVVNVNDAPSGAERTVALLENHAYPLSAGDFGFADGNEATPDTLAAIILTSLPSQGTLTLNGVPLVALQSIAVGQLAQLVYTPANGGTGANYDHFDFRVQDSGGTANGGVDTSLASYLVTFNVYPLGSTAPRLSAGGNMRYVENAAATAIDPTLTLDAVVSSMDAVGSARVVISSGLSAGDLLVFQNTANISGQYNAATGELLLSGVDTVANYQAALRSVAYASSSENPTLGSASRGITWTVTTPTSGISPSDTSMSASSSVTVIPVNDGPGGYMLLGGIPTNNSSIHATPFLSDAEGLGPLSYQWQLSTDGLTNWMDITGATSDTLFLGLGQVDKYVRLATHYVDGQGTAETFNFQPVRIYNDTATPLGGLTLTGTPLQGRTLNAGVTYSDPNGMGPLSYTWLRSTDGQVGWTGIPGASGSSYTLTQADANNYITVQVSYTDGLGSPKLLTGNTAYQIANINDAPSGTDATLSVAANASHIFAAADFGFTDVDTPANALKAVIIDSLPGAGTLTLNGVAVTAGQVIAATDLGLLAFTPAGDRSGAAYASFTFRLQDDGGTANSGHDTASVANTLTFDVTPPAVVALASVAAGNGGFVLNGEVSNDLGGLNVFAAGDVNGDGLEDFLVGAPYASPGGATEAGRNYLVFGKADGTAVQLSDVAAGIGGFAIDGQAAGDQSGFGLMGIGDLNGDGLSDLLIGAFGSDPAGGVDAGRSYVVFGKADGTAVSLSDIANGNGGFVINGEAAGDQSGYLVSAGDVNGDGLVDLLIGAASFSGVASAAGRSYVVFGRAGTTAVALSDVAAGIGGFAIDGEAAGDSSGYGVAVIGDVNGDGLADLLITAPGVDPSGGTPAGRAYVVFGKADGSAVSLSSIVAGTGGFAVMGSVPGQLLGYAGSAAGDLNGDGMADFALASRGLNGHGLVYAIYGKSSTAAVDLNAVAAGNGGFTIVGESADDLWVANIGDFNGDGLGDLVVSDAGFTGSGGASSGRSYVVFGTPGAASVQLSDVAAGIGGFILDGAAPNDTSGWTVAPGGDINGDGLADLLVGAPYASPGGLSAAGQGYVLFGGTQWLSHVVQGSGTVSGTAADEVLVGSSGADTLAGGGGIDRFYAGAGDDVITLGAADITHLQAAANGGPYAMVAGGTGIDTLRLTGGASLDFSQIAQIAAGVPNISSRLSSIERLDLASDSAANTVDLRLQDLLDLSGLDNFNSGSGWSGLAANVARHQLRIDGAAGDQVVLHLADGWTNTGSATFGGVSYAIWDSAGSNAGQLLVAGASVAVI